MNEQWEQVARVQKVEMRWNQPMNQWTKTLFCCKFLLQGKKRGEKEWQTFLATPDLILFFLFAQFFFVLNI